MGNAAGAFARVVVVKDGNAAAGGFYNVIFRGGIAIDVEDINARLGRDVFKPEGTGMTRSWRVNRF